jgi:hypothetical protein
LGASGVVDHTVASFLAASALASFAGSWIALGVSALRRGPIRAIAPT